MKDKSIIIIIIIEFDDSLLFNILIFLLFLLNYKVAYYTKLSVIF